MAFDTSFLGIPTCQPAVLFLFFGLFFVVVDLLTNRVRRASVRAFYVAVFVGFLHILCLGDMNIISQGLVLLPFVIFTAVVSLSLYALQNSEVVMKEDAPIIHADLPAEEIPGEDVDTTDIEEISKNTIRLFGVRFI